MDRHRLAVCDRCEAVHASIGTGAAAALTHSPPHHLPPSSKIKTTQHEIVPVPLIDAIAGLRHGSTVRCLRTLAKAKLVHHDNSK